MESGKLLLHQALELRSLLDDKIATMRSVAETKLYGNATRYAEGYDPSEAERILDKLAKKRAKLNHAIQYTNITTEFDWKGEKITLAEAVERVTNNISSEKAKVNDLKEKLLDSRFMAAQLSDDDSGKYVYVSPRYKYKTVLEKYNESLIELFDLKSRIHELNHSTEVPFSWEGM